MSDETAFTIAQTNLHLYRQLLALHWSEAELLRVQKAYTQAAERFAKWLRPSGKPFLAHLVGTASLAVMGGANCSTACAALLHSCRTHNIAVAGRRIPRLKARFPHGVSTEIKNIITAYELWHRRYAKEAPAALDVTALSDLDRKALLIHLANEADEVLDGSAALSKPHKVSRRNIDSLTKLALDLSLQPVATILTDYVDRPPQFPEGLHVSHTASYVP